MRVRRALGSITFALALGAPLAAAAQTAPGVVANPVGPQTTSYFNAIAQGDIGALANATTSTFQAILPDGKRLSFDDYARQISANYIVALPPMGNRVDIKASASTATNATETVETRSWFYGAPSLDISRGQRTQLDFATHQLTWIKSANGIWLLAEDHITLALET